MATAKIGPLGPIKFVTVHCSGSPAGRGNVASDVRAWDMQRFQQPSYHYVVEESGNVVRHLTDEQKGCHVALHNTGNIGICYIGGVDKNGKNTDTRTVAQRLSLRLIIADIKKKHPGVIVRGHRDWPDVHKDCPCFDVASQL